MEKVLRRGGLERVFPVDGCAAEIVEISAVEIPQALVFLVEQLLELLVLLIERKEPLRKPSIFVRFQIRLRLREDRSLQRRFVFGDLL